MTVAALTPSQGSCPFLVPLACNLGALAIGAQATVTLVVTPTAAGLATNQVTVSAALFDPQLANNTSNQSTNIMWWLALPLVRR